MWYMGSALAREVEKSINNQKLHVPRPRRCCRSACRRPSAAGATTPAAATKGTKRAATAGASAIRLPAAAAPDTGKARIGRDARVAIRSEKPAPLPGLRQTVAAR